MLSQINDYQLVDSQLEMASLETDIMRFLAILGFCLMIIFALVQSLPVSSSQPSIEQANNEKASLLLQMKNQQIMVSALLLENERLKQNKQMAAQQLNALTDQFQVQMQLLEQMALVLSKNLSKNLSKKEQRLRILQSVNQQSQAELDGHRQQLAQLQAKQEAMKQAVLTPVQASKKPLSLKTNEPAPPTNEPAPQSKQSTGKKGFTLRFASNQLFKQLVLYGVVDLYLQTGHGHQKYLQGTFVSQPFDGQLYGMDETTVPEAFVGLARGSVPSIKGWYVSLPPKTVQDINRLLSANKQGDLVIVENAQVQMSP